MWYMPSLGGVADSLSGVDESELRSPQFKVGRRKLGMAYICSPLYKIVVSIFIPLEVYNVASSNVGSFASPQFQEARHQLCVTRTRDTIFQFCSRPCQRCLKSALQDLS